MASITNLTLDVEVVNDGANLVANVTAAYTIGFSDYDVSSNQPYREACKLIGDDTGITPAEDGCRRRDRQRPAVPAAAVPEPRAVPAPDPAVQTPSPTARRPSTASIPRRSA